jgi:hypothetical protein
MPRRAAAQRSAFAMTPARARDLPTRRTQPLRGVLVAILAFACALLAALPGRAGTIADLDAALALGRTAEILSAEGVGQGEDLEDSLFPGQGGARWAAMVAEIHDADRLYAELSVALAGALADAPQTEIDAMVDFFASDLGARVVDLELSARAALADPAVQDLADLALEDARAAEAPELAEIARFIAANDLIERNVMGAMNANVAFMRGLSDGGGVPGAADEGEAAMLADIWAQEEALRAESEAWVWSFLNLAYDPLGTDEIAAYVAFSETAAGARLNAALFAAFDALFEMLSYELGNAAASMLAGEQL